jgi:hypothetical protein
MDDLYFRGTTQPCVILIFCLLRNDVQLVRNAGIPFDVEAYAASHTDCDRQQN